MLPELHEYAHALLLQVLLGSCHVDLDLGGAGLLATAGDARLEDAEDALDAEGHADAGHVLVLRVEHADEVVVAAAACHAADPYVVAWRRETTEEAFSAGVLERREGFVGGMFYLK